MIINRRDGARPHRIVTHSSVVRDRVCFGRMCAAHAVQVVDGTTAAHPREQCGPGRHGSRVGCHRRYVGVVFSCPLSFFLLPHIDHYNRVQIVCLLLVVVVFLFVCWFLSVCQNHNSTGNSCKATTCPCCYATGLTSLLFFFRLRHLAGF